MVVGVLQIDLRLPGCRSLKDKRRVIRSLVERVRRNFKVSIAEVADQELWGNASLGVAVVSESRELAASVISVILNMIDEHAEYETTIAVRELVRFD